MTVLVDWQIRELCESETPLVTPCDPSLVNPASIDVRVGNTAEIELEAGFQKIDLTRYSQTLPYLVPPKAFILVGTLEVFHMPVNVAGEFRVKSSRAREGWNQCLAVRLDPRWHGSVLTLELINELRYHSLPLYPGLKIGQIVCHQTETPDRDYSVTGRYNHDLTVMGSKG